MYAVGVFFLSFLLGAWCYDDGNSTYDGYRKRPKQLWNETFMDRLRNDLLTNYDKYARPGQHYELTNIKIGLVIWYLETEESNSTVTVLARLQLAWRDPKLQWNPDYYGGVKVVKMADHEIWQPDIYLYNRVSSSAEAVNRYGNPYALVVTTGDVLWMPPTKFSAICKFDLYYWPFDTQNCDFKLISWTHSEKDIKMELYKNELGADLDAVDLISAWDVTTKAEVSSDFSDFNSFYNAQFNVTITRKSGPYITVVFTPAIAIVVLILVQCWMPPQSGHRIILNSCTAIMVTILLTHFTQKVFSLGSSPPLIVLFYTTTLYLIVLSLAESIFVQLILGNKNKNAVPDSIRSRLGGKLGKVLLLDTYTEQLNKCQASQVAEELKEYNSSVFEEKHEEHDEIIKSTSQECIDLEWNIFVIALDRIMFVAYSFVFIILAFLVVI